MQPLINYFIENGQSIAIWLIMLSYGFKFVVSLPFAQSFFKRKNQTAQKKQDQSLSLTDNVQKNYFENTNKIIQQNKQFNLFLKQNILKQLSSLNSKYDLLQRWVITVKDISKQNRQIGNKIFTSLKKPYLQKAVAKQLLDTIMSLHIRKKIDYLSQLKLKYKQTINKQKIIMDIYRVFKQITRQQVEFLDNFSCGYGDLGNPLRYILQTDKFKIFVNQQIYSILQKDTQQMLQSAEQIMQKYKDEIISAVQRI